MAFVRWRGSCAQLLATVYEQGKTRKLVLANLHGGYFVPESTRQYVTERFPDVSVDWNQVEEALAVGPKRTSPPTVQEWDYLRVEQALRAWARDPHMHQSDVQILQMAAQVMTNCRARLERSAIDPKTE